VVLSVVAAVLIAVNDPGKIAMDPWRIDAAYLQGVVGYRRFSYSTGFRHMIADILQISTLYLLRLRVS